MKFADVNNGGIFDRVSGQRIGVSFNNSVYKHAEIVVVTDNTISLEFEDTKQIEVYSMDELNESNIGFYQIKLYSNKKELFDLMMETFNSDNRINACVDIGFKSDICVNGRGSHYYDGNQFRIVDEEGNIVLTIDYDGIESITIDKKVSPKFTIKGTFNTIINVW